MPRPSCLHSFMAIAAAASLCVCTADAADLIFADVLNDNDPDGNSIRAIHLDGTGLRTLIPTGGGVRGIDVDAAGGYIYWTDVDNFAVRRARFDGSGQQDLVTAGVAFPSALRLDRAAGRMYWGDQTSEELRRANLDGMLSEPLTTTPFFRGVAIDPVHSRVYWTVSLTPTTGRIVNANLDGSDEQIAVPITGPSFKPGNIVLDVAGGKIYWTDAVTRSLRRSNLNGSNIELLFDGSFSGPPKGIVLDLPAGHIYFGVDIRDADSDGFLFGEIRRMDLNGGNMMTIAGGLGSVNDLVLADVVICRADFNGDGSVSVQDIFDFLVAYFGGDPLADFNRNGSVTVQDIFDFLAAYFTGCA